MGEESRQVELCLVGAVALWALSFALLSTESLFLDTGGILARWGVWTALVATVWSMNIIVKRQKRSVVKGVAREIAFQNRPDAREDGELRVMR